MEIAPAPRFNFLDATVGQRVHNEHFGPGAVVSWDSSWVVVRFDRHPTIEQRVSPFGLTVEPPVEPPVELPVEALAEVATWTRVPATVAHGMGIVTPWTERITNASPDEYGRTPVGQNTRPVHFKADASTVMCGALMRHWRDRPDGWDLGTTTVEWSKVTCEDCRGYRPIQPATDHERRNRRAKATHLATVLARTDAATDPTVVHSLTVADWELTAKAASKATGTKVHPPHSAATVRAVEMALRGMAAAAQVEPARRPTDAPGYRRTMAAIAPLPEDAMANPFIPGSPEAVAWDGGDPLSVPQVEHPPISDADLFAAFAGADQPHAIR